MSPKLIGAVGAIVLVASCAGCAGIAPDQAEEKQEKVYRTGSNIPQKERVGSGVVNVDPSTVQDAVRSRSATGAGNLGR